MLIGAAIAIAFAQGFTRLEPKIDPRKDCLETPKSVLALMPPELVVGEPILHAHWSKDGQWLLMLQQSKQTDIEGLLNPWIEQQPAIRDSKLLLWSKATKKTTTLFSLQGADANISDFGWMGESPCALFTFEQHLPSSPDRPQPVTRLVAMESFTDGRTKALIDRSFPDEAGPSLELRADADHQAAYLHLRATNRFGAGIQREPENWLLVKGQDIVPVKTDEQKMYMMLNWDADSTLHLGSYARTGNEFVDIDPRTGSVKQGREFVPNSVKLQRPELSFLTTRINAKVGNESTAITCLWLTSREQTKHPRAMVCQEPGWYDISPTLDAVAYVSQNSMFVRRLTEVPEKTYLAALLDWDKRDAMSRAKQIGTALAMLANDNNDQYPAAGNINSLLLPFTKDESIFGGFTYTFQGGGTSGIENPNTAVLGYVDTPSGRAIIYADSHVKWKDKP